MAADPGTHFVFAKLWAPIQPFERNDRYEDPLHDALKAADLGEVTGSGTFISPEGEIEYGGLDLELANLEGALELCRRVLEQCGAPRGSQFEVEGASSAIPFGVSEVIALYLDGVNLPAAVYASTDINVL